MTAHKGQKIIYSYKKKCAHVVPKSVRSQLSTIWKERQRFATYQYQLRFHILDELLLPELVG